MIDQEILQPNPQNAQQDTDWAKVYTEYYDKGFSLIKAKRKLKTQYPDVWRDHQAGLISFYESKKKIQEDQPQLDSSSEEVSTESTSDTDQQSQQESGDLVSTTQETKLDTIVGKKPTAIPTYQLASAEIIFDQDEDYISKFGEGPVFKLNPNRLLTEEKDSKIFTDLQLLEESSFDRWYNKTVSEDPRLASNIETFLSSPENAMLKGHIDLGLPLHYVKDGILDMLAVLDAKPDEFDVSQDEVDSSTYSGRLLKSSNIEDMTPGEKYTGRRIQRKTMKRLEKSYNDFFRDMVFQSLPQEVRLNENKLKDLEYYFKLGSDNLFDFTGDKEIGNKTWWQDSLTSAELGGMTFTNKMGYLGSRLMGFIFDTTFGEGEGDSFREGFDKGVAIREKEMEDMRSKMNSYEESISKSLSNFFETGDFTSLNNYFEQSFLMTAEASPQIAMAIGGGTMGLGPTGIALMLTADGIATEAYTISNDITFDDFIDKESGEKLTYYEALKNIPVSETDTLESLEQKLRVMYDIETNNARRGMYLGSIAVTDFAADRITFGIAARALRNTKFSATSNNKDLVRNLLAGSGIAIPESAIPTFLSAWNREYQKASQTGDPNWDAYEAYERALDITLGVLPLGPVMHVGGTSLAYTKHLANSRIGKDGMNAQQRKLLETLQETADNPHVSSEERMQALQFINQIKKEGRAEVRKAEAFYEYVGQRSQTDLDQITNIDLRLQRFVRQYDATKNPELKVLIRDKMADLIKMRDSVESKYNEGFESSYDVTFREPVSGREYTVRFDEEGGIVPPKDDADVKPKDEADVTPEGEAPPVITPDDANRKTPDEIEGPLEGEPRNNDTNTKIEEEEAEVARFKGGWLRKLFRETFRTDAGVGGTRPGRGLAFWKKRKYADVADIILEQQRVSASLRTQVGMDLGMLDILFQDLRFDVNGKKISSEEYSRRAAELNKYMKGDPNAKVAFLDESQKSKVDYLRGRIDAATDDIIRLLEENPTEKNKALVELLKSNKGHYLKRSYEAFTDNGTWLRELSMRFDEMPADKKALFDDAVDFIINQEGFKGSRLEARKIVTSYIQDINRKISSGDFAYGSGTIGALDTKMFAGRKDIPEPFRKLLGEIDDVNFNYVNTMHRLTGYVSDLQYQKSLKQSMLDLGLASETSQQGLVPLETGKAYSGLDGLYVDPVFKEMYDGMMPIPVSPSKFWRTIHGFQGLVKIGKTQYSPTTTARNLISGNFLGLNSGHFFLTNPNAIAMAKDLAWGDPNVVNQNKRLKEATLDLIRKGVLGDGARASEALKMLRDWSELTEANRIAQQQGGSKARKAARKLRQFTERTYAFGDDFFKVTGYYIEMNKLLRDSPNMTKAEAADIAANRIRNGYPTYSMIPRNIKKLRRFPLSGMFVSFPYEVYRTTANNLRFIAEDLAAGRVRMASERLLGMTVANGLGFSLFNYSKDILGYDDEDVDAIRALGSSFSANSRPMLLPMSEEGDINYLDMRSFLPQEQIWGPVMTILGQGDPTDENFMERVNTAIGEALSPFTAADATSKFAFEIFNNRRVDTGAPIYYYDQDKNVLENILDNDEEITKYLMRGVGPGVYNNLVDFLRANEVMPEVFGTKETPYKEFSNSDAILALLGFRVQTLNLKTGTIQAIHEENMDLNGYINFHLTKSDINLWTRQDPEYLSKIGFEYADKQAAVSKRLMKMVNFAVKSKMTQEEFIETLVQSGISKADAGLVYSNVTKGTDMPLSPKIITDQKFESLYNYIKDSHRGTDEELKEKVRSAMDAVITFNLNVIEKWKTYFPNYELKDDKENFEFYKKVNKR
tara:strand:+ start:3920 stop:9367 length:5448 start_codon:yes stop_codon:yes gene_type:complete